MQATQIGLILNYQLGCEGSWLPPLSRDNYETKLSYVTKAPIERPRGRLGSLENHVKKECRASILIKQLFAYFDHTIHRI